MILGFIRHRDGYPDDFIATIATLFETPRKSTTPEQMDFVDYYLGSQYFASPEELRIQLLNAEMSYDKLLTNHIESLESKRLSARLRTVLRTLSYIKCRLWHGIKNGVGKEENKVSKNRRYLDMACETIPYCISARQSPCRVLWHGYNLRNIRVSRIITILTGEQRMNTLFDMIQTIHFVDIGCSGELDEKWSKLFRSSRI